MLRWISWGAEGQLEVNQEAEAELKRLERPMVISCIGFARLGKSFMMNQLCGRDCFPVSAGVSICTRGLNICIEGQTVYVDSEGLAGMAGGPDHDAKIFLLAFLLSSVLIYTSKGVIDEPSINQLSFVTQLTSSLQTENKPGLIWLLKDFVLDLRTTTGQEISPIEYLSKALDGDTALRQLIRDTFPVRDCIALVRPCHEETDLYDISKRNLRSEFRRGIDDLRRSITSLLKPRELKGSPITGQVVTM